MLDQKIDQLSCVLHEVDILVHGAVHDQQSTLLVWQLTNKVEDGAQFVAVRFVTRPVGGGDNVLDISFLPVHVSLCVASVVELPGRDGSPCHGHLQENNGSTTKVFRIP